MSKYSIRPLAESEKELFFAMKPEEDAAHGCIGHLRMDFGRNGTEFWSTWWPRGPEELNSPTFKAEFDSVVNELRETVLSGMVGMRRFCADNGGYFDGGWAPNYGYVIDTPNYRYCLRCIPLQGDYNAYLTAYDKQAQAQYLAAQNPESKYGDYWVSTCFDSGVERQNAITGETEICEGYFCEVFSDPYGEDKVDDFCLAVGYEISDLSDEAMKQGIRNYLGMYENQSPASNNAATNEIQFGGM